MSKHGCHGNGKNREQAVVTSKCLGTNESSFQNYEEKNSCNDDESGIYVKCGGAGNKTENFAVIYQLKQLKSKPGKLQALSCEANRL